MKLFYLVCIFFLSVFIARAQTLLVPVKDSISGLTGYKKAGFKSWQIKPSFESAEWFFMGSAIVNKEGKAGLINPYGKFILPPVYDQLIGDSLLSFQLNDSAGICDRKGKIFFTANLDHIILDEERKAAILLKDSLFGYWDTSGVIIPPFSFYELMFSNGLSYYKNRSGKGFINHKGEKLIEISEGDLLLLGDKGFVERNGKETIYSIEGKNLGCFEKILQVTDSLIVFRNNGKYGLMNLEGKLILEVEYEIGPFNSNGIATASNNGKFGVLNTKGQMLTPFAYDNLEKYCLVKKDLTTVEKEKEFVLYQQGKLFGVLNDKGETEVNAKYSFAKIEEELLWYLENDSLKIHNLRSGKKVKPSEVLRFNLNRAIVCMNETSGYGLIDRHGKFILPPTYQEIKNLYNTYYICSSSYGTGLIDSSGNEVIKPVMEQIKILGDIQPSASTNFTSDDFLYLITKSGAVGVTNMEGEQFTDTIWANSTVFDEDGQCFFVKNKKGKWDILNVPGKKYALGLDTPSLFVEQYAIGKKKGKYGILNPEKKFEVKPRYDQVIPQEKASFFRKDSLWGLLSTRGKVISYPQFKVVSAFNEGLALVNKKEQWGFLDESGVFTPGYKKLFNTSYSQHGVLFPGIKTMTYTSLNGFDELTFDLLADSLSDKFKRSVNELILSSISKYFEAASGAQKPLLVKQTLLRPKTTYKGLGVEVRGITLNTVSLEFYRESFNEKQSEVVDSLKVFYFENNSLKRVSLKDLFNNKEWVAYLNEVIASRLREENFSLISSHGSLVFFDMTNFAVTSKGLLLKLNETALGMSNDYSGQEMMIGFEEIEEIVKKEGVLREFYSK